LKDQVAGTVVTGVFDNSPLGVKRWECFKDRVVEHVRNKPKAKTFFARLQINSGINCVSMLNYLFLQNIRIMAKYYTRVTLKRMSQLLDFSPEVLID